MKKISFQNDILPLKNELYRLALRITLNPAEAEDVVQDTMIKVWNRREQWDEIESIEAFCLTICRNLSLDRMRKLENQNQSLEEGEVHEEVLVIETECAVIVSVISSVRRSHKESGMTEPGIERPSVRNRKKRYLAAFPE